MTKARDSNGQVTPLCESLLASAILGSLVTPRMQREKKDKVGFFFVEEVDEQVDGECGEKMGEGMGWRKRDEKGVTKEGGMYGGGKGKARTRGESAGRAETEARAGATGSDLVILPSNPCSSPSTPFVHPTINPEL